MLLLSCFVIIVIIHTDSSSSDNGNDNNFNLNEFWMQDLPLFNDSIYYNILYGRLGASEEEILGAAKQAAVHDQILAMPDGWAHCHAATAAFIFQMPLL